MEEDSAQDHARIAEEARARAGQDRARAKELKDRVWAESSGGMRAEWLRELGVIYGGLIGIAVVMVQPFLAAKSLNVSAKICVIAFSVAIPLLAALLMVNRLEAFRRRRTPSVIVNIAQVVAELSAFVGIVAGFWHILWIAGVAFLAAGVVAMGVHSAGYVRLEFPGSEKWWSVRRNTTPGPQSSGTQRFTS